MNAVRRKWNPVPPLVVAVVAAAVGLALGHTEFVHKLDLRLVDYAFIYRDRLRPHSVRVDPAIRLVLFDEDTDAVLPEPHVFWLPYYKDVLAGIFQGGATAVGVDNVFAWYDEKNAPTFAAAVAPYSKRLVFIGYMAEDFHTGIPRLVLPDMRLAMLIGLENVGLANLTRDLDGVPRAQQVFPLGFPDVTTGHSDWAFFAPLMAERHTGRSLDARRGTFGRMTLPLLGDARSSLLINYAGAASGTFPSIAFQDVLNHARAHDEKWLSEQFRGKVVLVANGSRASQDISTSPFSALTSAGPRKSLIQGARGGDMLGIEVQANVLNTLLTGAWLRRAPPWANTLWLATLCVITAFGAYRLGVVAGAAAAAGLLVGSQIASFGIFCLAGIWVDGAATLLVLPLVWGGTYSYRYLAEERQRAWVQKMFGRYVSPDVMEELLDDPGKLTLEGGDARTVTIFFSDINGFTTVSEANPPEQVFRMLNAYYADMTEIIFAHRGTIKQFVGDEIMVLFGAPREHPEPERAAIRTALDMIDRLETRRAADPDGSQGFYEIKIGIHTGRVLVGNIGSAERTEYTTVGDSVNLASRIMNMTKDLGGHVLISDVVYRQVSDMVDVTFIDHGPQPIRGRHNEIRIYEVRRAHPQKEASHAI